MTPAHTPGPWFLLSHSEAYRIISRSVGPDWSAEENYVGEVTAHNARLISKAPELLAFVECVSRGLTNGQKERGETFQEHARALLSRVKGGSYE